jgi:MFS family permease
MSPAPARVGHTEAEPSLESDLLLDDAGRETRAKSPPPFKLMLRLYSLVFFVNLAIQILAPAQTQIYESIYCAQWYARHPVAGLPDEAGHIPESYCKLAPIQTQISTLKGWMEFFAASPALLLSIPMGILADRIGRRRLLIVNLFLVTLTQVWIAIVTWFDGRIPLRAIWLGAGLNLFTGGPLVTELLYIVSDEIRSNSRTITDAGQVILTDISPSDRVQVLTLELVLYVLTFSRAEMFFRANAFNCFSKVVGPFIAGGLMRFDPWLAIYCGHAFLVLSLLLLGGLPETLHWHRSEAAGSPRHQDPQDQAGTTHENGPRRHVEVERFLKVWSDWRLVFVALTYPFRLICTALGDLLQRYVSDRYGWTLADATFVYSLQAIFGGVVLFTLLPLVSSHIDQKFRFSIIQKNVVLTRFALVALALAYTIIGLAPTAPVMMIGLVVETLSGGLPATLRAIATAVVDEDDRGRAFSVLALAETMSTMIAYPLTAALFNIGIEKGGGSWLGLPYDLVALIALFGLIIMCVARFERPMRL